ECGAGAYCGLFVGRGRCCRRAGAACGSPGDAPCCDGEDACTAGHCPECSVGGTCRNGDDCCNGNCQDGYCQKWRLGHACVADRDCASNLCAAGTCKCGIYDYATHDSLQCCLGFSYGPDHCVNDGT